MVLYDTHFVQDLHTLGLCISQGRLGCAVVIPLPTPQSLRIKTI